jgi:RimJ/RimL family protein N-acetyltransferase
MSRDDAAMTGQKTLRTGRLSLRPLTLDDLDAIVAMDSDEEVCRYIGGPREPVAHRARMRADIVDGRPAPYFTWAIEWRERAGFLGRCLLATSPLPGTTEIGWRLPRTSWDQGIASEAASAILHHAHDELRVGPVVALIHPDNAASLSVARKIGLRPDGEMVARGARQLVYRLD